MTTAYRTPRKRKIRLTYSSRAFFKKDDAAAAARALAKGWGIIGRGPYYPYIPVHLFAGSGFSFRITCPITGEVIHCHSIGEANVARWLLWQRHHVRLFSQVVIPRQDSMREATALKIRHPLFRDGTPSVRTIDFMHLTTGEQWSAYSVKARPESISKRDAELMAIERRYCRRRGIKWRVAFKYGIDPDFLANVLWIEGLVGVSPLIWGSDKWRELEPTFYERVCVGGPLNKAARFAERKLGMPKNTGLTLVRFFLANRIWDFDFYHRVNPHEPLRILGRNTGNPS